MSGLGRVSQLAGEAIGVSDAWLRVSVIAEEVIGPVGIDARVDQLGGEVIGILQPPASNLRLAQLAGEVIGLQIGSARVNQFAGEALGIGLVSSAFVVTSGGSLHTAATADIHLDDTSTSLVDSGGSLSAVDSVQWGLRDTSIEQIVNGGTVKAVGNTVVALDRTSLIVDGGTVTLGASSAAVTSLTAQKGASLLVQGGLTLDDTSGLTLGRNASLIITRRASLMLSDVQYVVDGALTVSTKVVINGNGGSLSGSGPVIANFTWVEAPGAGEPYSIFFTDTSTLFDPFTASWSWSFGDGSPPSAIRNAVHIYPAPGDYTVALTVTQPSPPGPPGVSTMTQVVTVTDIT